MEGLLMPVTNRLNGLEYHLVKLFDDDELAFKEVVRLAHSDDFQLDSLFRIVNKVVNYRDNQNIHLLALVMSSEKTKAECVDRFVKFVKAGKFRDDAANRSGGFSLMAQYLSVNQFVELHLDNIFTGTEWHEPHDGSQLWQIFQCANIRFLSLKNNNIGKLPAHIGYLNKLEYLCLTGNRLTNQPNSIPYTLVFCCKLHTLYLDYNLLDALPGFLLNMKSLSKVQRHGNHNYFKATFMFYHTDVNQRILTLSEYGDGETNAGENVDEILSLDANSRGGSSSSDDLLSAPQHTPTSYKTTFDLQFWSAKAIIGNKLNFFHSYSRGQLARPLWLYLCEMYEQFDICHHCNFATHIHDDHTATRGRRSNRGYKVITFHSPYLGNSCVPFQHYACSLPCAEGIEIPARLEQLAASRRQDSKYQQHISEVQQQLRYPVNPRRTDQCRPKKTCDIC